MTLGLKCSFFFSSTMKTFIIVPEDLNASSPINLQMKCAFEIYVNMKTVLEKLDSFSTDFHLHCRLCFYMKVLDFYNFETNNISFYLCACALCAYSLFSNPLRDGLCLLCTSGICKSFVVSTNTCCSCYSKLLNNLGTCTVLMWSSKMLSTQKGIQMQFPSAREMLIYYNQRLSSMIQLLIFTLSKSMLCNDFF